MDKNAASLIDGIFKSDSAESRRIRSLIVALITSGILILMFTLMSAAYTGFDVGTRDITVEYSGKTELLTVKGGTTVKEALALCGIDADSNDIVNQALEKKVSSGMVIKYTEVFLQCNSLIEEVGFETEIIESQTIPKGTENVISEGSVGSRLVYTEDEYRDGEFYEEREINSDIIAEPVNRVVEVGVGGIVTAQDGTEYAYSYYIDVSATAYYGLGPYTKSGKRIRVGMIAVDPTVISLGTKVFLTGDYKEYGVVSCEDTGGAIKGNIVDIYMATYEDCCDFGRRPMRVYILEDQEAYADLF